MDPKETLAQIAEQLGLEGEPTRDQLVAALDAMAALVDAQSGEPAEEAEASDAPEATAAPEMADTPEGSATAELQEDGSADAALESEAVAAVAALAEAAGMDVPTLLAALRDRAEDVAALLAGGPQDGTAAEQMAASGAAAEATKAALSTARARTETLEQQLAKRDTEIKKQGERIAELEQAGRERQVDEAIGLGHFLPGHRTMLLSFAKSDPAGFAAELKGAAASPAIPMADIAVGKNAGEPGEDTVSPSEETDATRRLRVQLKAARVSEKAIEKTIRLALTNQMQGRT